ncbi:MAG: TfoX/Sxy family protein [Clostridiales bacterium]|jgi:DNA transformation protein|nr:TfoX/Sxy family protein [Clostridiales bacterium]
MSELTSLPNVGKVLAQNLNAVGISTAEELRKVGTKEAFMRIRTVDPGACVQMLYGLHGAVTGIKDRELTKETKDELKEFFRGL